MRRDYTTLVYTNEERKRHYEYVNSSTYKHQGDIGEQLAEQWFLNNNYEVRRSTPTEDAYKHVDLWVHKIGTPDVWRSVDVKYKRDFWLELKNNWGNKGWLYTGAEYIFQIFTDSKKGYLFKRNDMVNWVEQRPGLFKNDYCTYIGKAKLWKVYDVRIKNMDFLKEIVL